MAIPAGHLLDLYPLQRPDRLGREHVAGIAMPQPPKIPPTPAVDLLLFLGVGGGVVRPADDGRDPWGVEAADPGSPGAPRASTELSRAERDRGRMKISGSPIITGLDITLSGATASEARPPGAAEARGFKLGRGRRPRDGTGYLPQLMW